MGPVWAVVVAAGAGTRFGGAKQYAELAGDTVLSRSVARARSACDGVVIVVPAGDETLPAVTACDGDAVATGGASRSASVRAGLAKVPLSAGVIVVHDAARPLAGPALFRAVVSAVGSGIDGAICGVALADTLCRVDGDRVVDTVDRTHVVAVQTPQAFVAAALRAAHAGDPEATDDAILVRARGGNVVVVPGDPRNLKVTAPADLLLAEAFAR